MILRRSRGHVPRAIPLRHPVARPILATGGLLKNTFCLAHGASAYLGPHVGDLDNLLAFEFFAEAVERMERLVHVRPEVIAHDLHPDYASTHYAAGRAGARVAVQHHHAHVAAVMAEHGLGGPVLGLAWDGSGLGTDGTSWGSELMLADAGGFERLATLRPIALAGGDAAVRQVWRIALALLDDAFDGAPPLERLPLFAEADDRDVRLIRQMMAGQLNTPRVHGLGRLFDGVGALGLARPRAHHEGQVAMAWNHAAGSAPVAAYPYALDLTSSPWELDHRPLIRAAVADLLGGVLPGVIAARFHQSLIDAGAALVRAAIHRHGRLPVVLGGGCFQNPRLTEGMLMALADLEVHVPRAVPPGDGGLALGQVLIAAAWGGTSSCA
jgi:hydrogenase maturation protein HypF